LADIADEVVTLRQFRAMIVKEGGTELNCPPASTVERRLVFSTKLSPWQIPQNQTSSLIEPVDPPHYPLCPLDCARDKRFSPGAGARVMQVFRVLEVPSDKYAGYDRQNSFASFFHP
jgi:hypothetical protein